MTDSVQKNFVDQACLTCHQAASTNNRYVDLTDISKIAGKGLVNEPSGPRHDIIKPGCPKQSFILSVIKEGKMPPPPAARPTNQSIKAIEDWITSLKPHALCEIDEPSGSSGGDEPGRLF